MVFILSNYVSMVYLTTFMMVFSISVIMSKTFKLMETVPSFSVSSNKLEFSVICQQEKGELLICPSKYKLLTCTLAVTICFGKIK